MVAIARNGSLEETPLPHLLLDLYRGRFDGTLRLTRERLEKSFLFQEGIPVFAESNLASETLGVQLMDAGRITREDYDRVSTRVREAGCKEGVALLELGVLEPKALFVALKEQVRGRLLDCFGWTLGQFSVEPSEAPPADAQPFRADVYALLQEGIATHWSADRILAELAPHMDRSVARTRKLSRIQERLLWDDAVQSLIDALDGTRTLWRALQDARTPNALAAAWVLDAAGALDYRDPSATTDDGAPPEIEIILTEEATPQAASGRARPARPEREVDTGRNAVLLQEIEEKAEKIEELDHYALLGVASDAAPDGIRRAYLDAAKRYHPDALARAGLDEDTRDRAGRVFAAIGKAHAVLSNPARRRDYDVNLASDETDLDAERLAAAETNYRKAVILSRQGNFKGALEYLAPAVELWPEEGTYWGAYGWALYKKLPSDVQGAREALEKAYELEPRDPEIVYRLSVVLKECGDTVASTNLLTKARQLDPDIA